MLKPSDLIEQTRESREIFKGALLHVWKDTAILPDGSESTREWIKHPGACAVVPIFENGDVMMIHQYRYPVRELCLEVPAGKIDAGEDIESTARRELEEEAGVIAANLHYIGKFFPGVGYSDEVIHIFAGTELTQTDMNTDDDEFLIRERIAFEDCVRMVDEGKIHDGKTQICILRTWRWWQARLNG
jgi:ADP-ribose pyrophosphatase